MADSMTHTPEEHSKKREETAVRDDAVREPVRQPEASLTVANAKTPEQPADHKTGRMNAFRDAALRHSPDFVVNNSVNAIAALHVGAELLMLKSGGMKFRQPAEGVPKLATPFYNLYRGLRGLDKVSKDGKAAQNVWALRSTTVGFAGWVIGLITPNKRDDSDSILEDVELLDRSKTGYVWKRVTEALHPFNPDNKRQFIGMGVTTAGVFSALSGLNNIGGDGRYYTNKPRALGGVVTALAGASLWFSVTDRDAWSRFGKALWLRLPLIGMSVHKMYGKTMEFKGSHDIAAFEKANKEWKYYGAGAAGFQTAAMVSYLFGGVQKLPDGTIVETKQQRLEAKESLEEKKRIAKEQGIPVSEVPNEAVLPKHDVVANPITIPSTKIGAVSQHEVAMPERVAAHAEQQAAATA